MTPHLIKMPGETGYPEGGYATRGKPTEAGRVRVLCTDAGGDQPVVALVDGECRVYLADGRYIPGHESNFDLIPLRPAGPAKWQQFWVNLYEWRTWGSAYTTQKQACKNSGTGATQVHLIEADAVNGLVEALERIAKNPYARRDVLGDIAANALRAYRERF